MYEADKHAKQPADAFLRHFAVLNDIVLRSGDTLEGNICFPGGTHRNDIDVIKRNPGPCADYLKSAFGDRFRMFHGSSLTVLPEIAEAGTCNDVDIVHLDGGHSAEAARTGLSNVVGLPRPAGLLRHLIVDDTRMPQIPAVPAEIEQQDVLRSETIGAAWPGQHIPFLEGVPPGAGH